MKPGLDPSMLADLGRIVAERMGLRFTPVQGGDLDRAFSRAANDLGFPTPTEFARWFMATPCSKDLIESMATYLTIGETYFFRENQGFEILERKILPEIIRRRVGGEQRLRFWSAGCATGEEPYTLAMLLDRMSDLLVGWELSILATDINPKALQKARAGIYAEYSFRNTPIWIRQKYFTKLVGGRLELRQAIRKRVKFTYFNLVDDPCPSLLTDTNAMDIILCRNVLMYFTPELAKRAVERLRLCLINGGLLLVSACELSTNPYSGFSPVVYPEVTFYQKADATTRIQKSTPVPPLSQLMTSNLPLTLFPEQPLPSSSPAPPSPQPPNRPPPPYQEALLCYQRGSYDKATERLIFHLAKNPDDPPSLALLSRIRANQGNLSEARQLADRAIGNDKLNAGFHYLRAMILLELGKTEEAAQSLRKVLYLDQNLVLAHFTLGNLALQRGKNKESGRHFDQALRILDGYRPDELLPESEGMPAGRLSEIIRAMAVDS